MFPGVQTERIEVMLAVKAAPEIGARHGETVCVAGVRLGLFEQPAWIRLFPVRWQWISESRFSKYDVIELDVSKHERDPRPESFRPVVESARFVRRLGSWKARDEIVGNLPRMNMCDLVSQRGWERTSLAVVKPVEILGFDWKYVGDSAKYDARQVRAMQGDLLDQHRAPLEICPYVFRLRYRCGSASCKGQHHQSIIDWELSEAWRKWSKDYPDDFLERIQQRWLHEMCDPSREPELFVGNAKDAPQAFMVLGIYRGAGGR
jgi:hypothetical protein